MFAINCLMTPFESLDNKKVINGGYDEENIRESIIRRKKCVKLTIFEGVRQKKE